MSKGNRKRRRELGLLPMPQKCGARTRQGTPCQQSPLAGSTRCRMHGGAAPQVLAKAKERLALAADDAVSTLIRIMSDDRISPADRRHAATAILDRAGIGSKSELDVTVAPWIGVLEGVVAEASEGQAMTRTHDYSTRLEAVPLLTDAQAAAPDEDVVDAELVEDEVDGRTAARPHTRSARIVRD